LAIGNPHESIAAHDGRVAERDEGITGEAEVEHVGVVDDQHGVAVELELERTIEMDADPTVGKDRVPLCRRGAGYEDHAKHQGRHSETHAASYVDLPRPSTQCSIASQPRRSVVGWLG
jgi:hypothetical protein